MLYIYVPPTDERHNTHDDIMTLKRHLMRTLNIFLMTATLILLAFCGSAMAANVTSCTVDTCNIYAGSNEFPIAPATQIDGTSTASAIASENSILRIADFSISNIPNSQQKKFSAFLQGSTITLSDDGKIALPDSYTLSFGDGTPDVIGNPKTPYVYHTYVYEKTYTAELTVDNQLASEQSDSITFKTTYDGYSTYTSTLVGLLPLIFILFPLLFLVFVIIQAIRGEVSMPVVIGAGIAILTAIVLLSLVIMVGGYMDNITAAFFK